MNTYEMAARHKKAAALVAVLRNSRVSASMAARGDAGDWRRAAKAADVKPPSPTTIALVLDILDKPEEPPR